MKIRTITLVVSISAFVLSSCSDSELPSNARIQINVPDESHSGTRIKLVTPNVQTGREIFAELFRTTRRTGKCSPIEIEMRLDADKVMSVSFWGDGRSFVILQNSKGKWMNIGYGGVEVFDSPTGFPQWKYSARTLRKVKRWYEEHVPEENRKIMSIE